MELKKVKTRTQDSLVAQFAKAGLICEVRDTPFMRVRGADDIFGMDIARKIHGNTRSEYFRIYKGAEENRVEVVNTDREIGQVILLVHEPEREFFEDVPARNIETRVRRDGDQWLTKMIEESHLSPKDVIVQGRRVSVRHRTPSRKRHYLCGLDERQLFIAQLPRGVSTVRDAHQTLKTTTVTLAEDKIEGRTIRQGEWFLVNVSDKKRREINDKIRKNEVVVLKKTPITVDGYRGGKPHVADELVRITGDVLEHGFTVRGRPEVFVRGKVRHPDHATVQTAEWRMAILNNEDRVEQSRGWNGIGWVD